MAPEKKTVKRNLFRFREVSSGLKNPSVSLFFCRQVAEARLGQLVVHFVFAKNGIAKRSKKREAKIRVKNWNLIFLTQSFASHF